MAIKNLNRVIPIMLDGAVTITADKTWGEDADHTVGLVKLNSSSSNGAELTFKSTDNPAEFSGAMVVVSNIGTGAQDVEIIADPYGDDTGDILNLAAGQSVTVMYHATHGWIWLGSTGETAA